MGAPRTHKSDVWVIARRQHGVITRSQLLECGLTEKAIRHRVDRGRLHRLHRGVFVVGRPELDCHGRWMAAVLASGPGALLSHRSAAELWQIRAQRNGKIEVSIPYGSGHSIPSLRLHRRRSLRAEDRTRHLAIPVTSPVRTLTDIATRLPANQLEAAVNEADKRDLLDPESLREALTEMAGQRGVPALRALLDGRTFSLTDSELERHFLRLVRATGLPSPMTGRELNGFRVDFYWPDLGLVVETDGLRYHRTPAQQAHDRRRDQVLTAAGLTTLRFTHAQIRFEPGEVREVLMTVIARLSRRRRAA
jgi:very-short-patch-repair endonuclease